MTARYSIVQYVPDPIADERINFGVIAYDAEGTHASFLTSWSRVDHFGREDTRFLREFARQVQDAIRGVGAPFTVEELERMVGGWVNSIQFTPPRASLKAAPALLEEAFARFLVNPQRNRRLTRDRRAAVSLATRGVRGALESHLSHADAAQLMHTQHVLQGALDRHHFDVVVANGVPYFAVHALSFEVPAGRWVDATAWQIDDVRQQMRDLPIGIVALPPREDADPEEYPANLEAYTRAQRVFHGLGATVLVEDTLARWAGPYAARVAGELRA